MTPLANAAKMTTRDPASVRASASTVRAQTMSTATQSAPAMPAIVMAGTPPTEYRATGEEE